jgi:hypothetical protein
MVTLSIPSCFLVGYNPKYCVNTQSGNVSEHDNCKKDNGQRNIMIAFSCLVNKQMNQHCQHQGCFNTQCLCRYPTFLA